MNEPRFLTPDDVLGFHEVLIARFGGMPGLRDRTMLESAVAMPQAGVDEAYLHEDLFEMAAAYLFHIVMNHPFVDGNKRAGAHAALVFLADNGFTLTLSQDAKYDLVIAVCEGHLTKNGVAAMFRGHATPRQKP